MSDATAAPTQDTPTPRSRDSVRHAWAQRLQRFAHAGLTPAQFCAQEGVSLPSFYSWKRRLAAPPQSQTPAEASTQARLLPITLAAPNAAVELVLPNGAVLRIPPGCDLALVRALLATLGERPC